MSLWTSKQSWADPDAEAPVHALDVVRGQWEASRSSPARKRPPYPPMLSLHAPHHAGHRDTPPASSTSQSFSLYSSHTAESWLPGETTDLSPRPCQSKRWKSMYMLCIKNPALQFHLSSKLSYQRYPLCLSFCIFNREWFLPHSCVAEVYKEIQIFLLRGKTLLQIPRTPLLWCLPSDLQTENNSSTQIFPIP